MLFIKEMHRKLIPKSIENNRVMKNIANCLLDKFRALFLKNIVANDFPWKYIEIFYYKMQ